MKLYEITTELRAILDAEELTDEQVASLESLGLALDAKVDGCCGLIREWEAVIAARRAEIDRLEAGLRTRENSIKRLKEYLRSSLEAIGEKKHETKLFTIRRQTNPPSAKCVVDPALLPGDLKRVKYEPDNKSAIERWKATGASPDGFEISVSEHLRIV